MMARRTSVSKLDSYPESGASNSPSPTTWTRRNTAMAVIAEPEVDRQGYRFHFLKRHPQRR
jgi:hypothetical protein